MGSTRTRKKPGRPAKHQSQNNTKYLNAKKSNDISAFRSDDDYDQDSNHSSPSNNTSSFTNSKYQTRSSRRTSSRTNYSATQNKISKANGKKRGRKRKLKEESEDEYYDDFDDFEAEPATQSDKSEDEMSEEEEDEFINDLEEESEDSVQDTKRRPAREKALVFLDDQELPELALPRSSEDLLISNQHLIRALSIYEILRHFSQTLRLTHFRFEDFCVILSIDEQTLLLSEIHIQLLKALIREDDLNGTQHGPLDIRDSINIHLHLCDHVTWPEVLRIYLSSDLQKNFNIIKECLDNNYPFNSLDKKLTLLEHLCDEFLNTQSARDMINNEGRIDHDEFCRACQKSGEMLMCDTCPAVFHLACLDPPLKQVPEQEWFCPICKQNQVNGVSDCVSEYERQMLRQEPIGWDRNGRQYWFLSRRIFVEDVKTGKVLYYSSRLQFDEMFECLDKDNYEKDLCDSIQEIQEEIYRQMIITEKLTKSGKGLRKSYLEVINEELYLKQSVKIKSELVDNGQSSDEKHAELEAKLALADEDLRGSGGGVQTRLKTGVLQPRSLSLDPFKNRANPYNSFSLSRDEDAVVIWAEDNETLTRISRKTLPVDYMQTNLFKLGFEGNYRHYQNLYSLNPHSLSKNQISDDRDKRRHLSHKFSLTPLSELKWGSYNQTSSSSLQVGSCHGPKSILISILRQALLNLEASIAAPFLHPNWRRHRDNWIKAISVCTQPSEFGLAMYILESSIKPVLFNISWSESLGFTVLQRSTQSERDELKKKEKRGRDFNRDSEILLNDHDGTGVRFIYGKLKHQIWKQKGEEYRLSANGGWFWNSKSCRPNLSKSTIEKEDVDENEEASEEQIIDISQSLKEKESNKRKRHYPKIFSHSTLDNLLKHRLDMINLERKKKSSTTFIDTVQEKKKPIHFCYSPTCDPNDPKKCYSPLCSSKAETKELIEVKDLSEKIELLKIIRLDGLEQFAKRETSYIARGQLPPCSRFSNRKHSSILIPMTYELRKLGRTSGSYEINGFNYNAKINYAIWPLGATPRPNFRISWLFRSHNITTFHAAALQLRVLWASLRWDDMAAKPPASGTNTFTTEVDVTTVEILKRRDLSPFGLRSEYMIRTIVVPIDLPVRTREISTPNRSGLRERRRPESPQNKGPTMTEKWIKEEELELWEIKLFCDKQRELAKQRAIQEQKQAELKRKMEEAKRQNELKLNRGSLNIHTAPKPMANRFGSIITSQPNKIISTSNSPSSTLPFTLQTSNGQPIKLQTMQTKPTQFIIRTSNRAQFVTSNSLLDAASRSGTQTAFIVKSPSVSSSDTPTRQIMIPANSIIRPVIHTNIRQPIPFVTTSCPKKISTVTTVNAILTTNTLKTVNVNTSSTTTTVSSVPVSILPTVNTTTATSTSKNIQCLPVKLIDGRTHLLPIGPVTSGTGSQAVQIALNSNNQVRLISKPLDMNSSTLNKVATTQKTFIVGSNSVLSPISTLIMANNQKVILPSKPTVTTSTVSTMTTNSLPSILSHSKTVNNSTSQQNCDSNNNQNESLKNSKEESAEKDLVVTSEMTQEVVRKALMNANVAPEIQQKLMALQRHHKEKADGVNHVNSSNSFRNDKSPQINPSPKTETPSRRKVITSRSNRYSKSKYDEDGDYIYEYPHSDRQERRGRYPRVKSDGDDIHKVCRTIVKQLVERIEKEERRVKHMEIREEKRIKKAKEMKLRFRQNHIELMRRNIARRKSMLNVEIQRSINNEIDKKLLEIKCTKFMAEKSVSATNNVLYSNKSPKREPETIDSSKISDDQNKLIKENQNDLSAVNSLEVSNKRRRLSDSKSPCKNDETKLLLNSPVNSNQKPPVKKSRLDQCTLNKKDSYCFCEDPSKKGQEMIGCDGCDNWFHLSCVNVSKKESRKINTYFCPDCSKNNISNHLSENSFSPNLKNESSTGAPKRPLSKTPTQRDVPATPVKRGRGRPRRQSNVVDNAKSNSFTVVVEHNDVDVSKTYCICREPYDHDKFYICCDSCNLWLHGRCVGVTYIRADDIAYYTCPQCEDPPSANLRFSQIMNDQDYIFMIKTLKGLRKHPSAWPFLKPVDAKEVPDYYKIIKEPMDLQTIERQVKTKSYTRFAEFIYDVYKIIDNCRYYNHPKTQYYCLANNLEEWFDQNIKAFGKN